MVIFQHQFSKFVLLAVFVVRALILIPYQWKSISSIFKSLFFTLCICLWTIRMSPAQLSWCRHKSPYIHGFCLTWNLFPILPTNKLGRCPSPFVPCGIMWVPPPCQKSLFWGCPTDTGRLTPALGKKCVSVSILPGFIYFIWQLIRAHSWRAREI